MIIALMYELRIERTFSAAHSLLIHGEREPVHGHDWRVRVVVAGPALDNDGLLCDFHVLERALDAIIAPFCNAHLNETPPFDSTNPTAERIAEHIGTSMMRVLPEGVTLAHAAVTEAVGCEAVFRASADRI